ncbi:hypothetical protein D1871_18450 [Nakamurella silvestris]|nr:hypothetical protein D1871_18450 [Nakamurella silvestris]
MDCEHCERSIHFGPLVAALRDEQDPALDDNVVGQLAWYHTSTWSDWPSPDYVSRTGPQFRVALERFGLGSTHDLSQHTTKTLHLGTYEAAIENMLRRMHDQADGDSRFYLYRVALSLDPTRINEGYRDENAEKAADLTVGDLQAAGLDAVRYLNVYESMGSLSLAVTPEVIIGIQCIPIPIEDLAALLPPDPFMEQKEALDAEAVEWSDAAELISTIDPIERRRMRLGLRPDPEGLIQRAEERELRRYALWHDFEDILAQYYPPPTSHP